MAIKASLIDPTDKVAVATPKYWRSQQRVDSDERVIGVTDPLQVHGTFKAVAITGAATIQLVEPNSEGSLILVGLTLTGDRVNGGSIEARWTDGTNTSIIIKPSTTDAPVNLFMQFSSRIQGWQDARIDVIVTGNIQGSVMANYVKVPKGIPFAEWDALR